VNSSKAFGRYGRFRRLVGICLFILVMVLTWSAPALIATDAQTYGKRKAIIRTARSYVGTPYYSMNCSRLTRVVYGRSTGVWMPANFVTQRRYGWVPGRLMRGDLLLYRDGVAIYWGDGRALMSSHYWGKVKIIDMQYLPGYLGARRIR
jgi:hypothetical protein